MKQARQSEVHFYEWSVSRWRTSSTRALLDGMGRGVYRELLDTCYAQGTILNPSASEQYLEALARDCGVTPDQFRGVWEIIRHHFVADKHDPSRLRNNQADCVRNAYYCYLSQQKNNGQAGGRPKSGCVKPAESGGWKPVGFESETHWLNFQNPKTKKKTNNIPLPPSGDAAAAALNEPEEHPTPTAAFPEPDVSPPLTGLAPPAVTRHCEPPEDGFLEEHGEAIYALHPKHTRRFEAFQRMVEIDRRVRHVGVRLEPGATPETDSARFWDRIREIHAAWSATEDWRKAGGRYAPQLAQWLDDEGWLRSPPGTVAAIQNPPAQPIVPEWVMARERALEAKRLAAEGSVSDDRSLVH